MKLLALEVEAFGCVEEAHLELGPGLNVLYGPNDLGKSTLGHALRAALLLRPSSSSRAEFQPWHKDATPRVKVVLKADDGRVYRLEKTFGVAARGSATLEWSGDGRDFSPEAQGRAVDARLRELLGWGLPEVGGRGGGRGLPSSFLATVLLGRQAQPASVFAESLQADGDADARERLTAALSAFAQDPLFKEVLERAQAEVDRAYTQGGKPSKSKDSPFRKIADRIVQLSTDLRTLDERVHDSDDVRTRITDLVERRDQAATERDEARAELARVKRDLERTRAREAAAERVAAADAAWSQIRAKIESLARLRDELHGHEADRPAAEAAHVRAAAAREEAADAMRAAKAEHERAIEGGAAEDRLARQSLLTRQAHAQAERQRAHDLVQAIDDAGRIAARHAEATTRATAIAADLRTVQERQHDAEVARREAEGRRRLAEGALALLRLQEAEARRDEIRASAARAAEHRDTARHTRASAEAVLAELDTLGLPSTETMRALLDLRAERRLALATLGGGVSLSVRLDAPRAITVRRDEAAAESAEGSAAFTVDAERRIVLALDGVGQLCVTAGDPRAREAAEAVQRRYAAEAEPTLAAAGVEDLDELARRVAAADDRRRQAEASLAEAERLERQAADDEIRGADLPHAEARVRERSAALAGLDSKALGTHPDVAGEGEATLRRRAADADTAIAEAGAVASRIGRELATLLAQRDQADALVSSTRAELDDASRRIGGEPDAAIGAAQDALSAAEGKLEAIEAELAELDEAGAGRRAATLDRLERARLALEEAAAVAARTAARLSALDQQIERGRGAIEVAARDVAELDEPAARARVEADRAALADLPAPSAPVSEADLAAARSRVEAAEAALRDVESELSKSEGALASVGGEVAREKAEDTRRALEDARRQEHEVELDYEGWRLLVQTLREAETTEGRHLGDALVEPIRHRFADLTAGRYGGLALGPDLEARGVQAAGGLRDLGDFSEGLQEQLATLLRVTIAERLGSTLVLDDHLTQTDPARIAWFRELLRQAAAGVQIVVLTCRPGDYLALDELPDARTPVRDADERLRAIDLARVVRRAGTAPT